MHAHAPLSTHPCRLQERVDDLLASHGQLLQRMAASESSPGASPQHVTSPCRAQPLQHSSGAREWSSPPVAWEGTRPAGRAAGGAAAAPTLGAAGSAVACSSCVSGAHPATFQLDMEIETEIGRDQREGAAACCAAQLTTHHQLTCIEPGLLQCNDGTCCCCTCSSACEAAFCCCWARERRQRAVVEEQQAAIVELKQVRGSREGERRAIIRVQSREPGHCTGSMLQ